MELQHLPGRHLLLYLFLSLIGYLCPPALSFNPPSHGCYWTDSCQSKWLGGCGAGHILIDQSDDCKGLCPEPTYPPCLPFHTHFRCCKPESPRVTEMCSKCRSKIDFGDEYICCTDCSDPYLVDKNTKIGYCKSGAELVVQLKPQETFNWVAGPWMKCSSPCNGGVRYRDVGCYGSIDDASIRHYPVDDSRCSADEMPTRQEPCNMKSCGDYEEANENVKEHSGVSGWLIALLILLGLVATGGLGFLGYIFYKRRTSTPSGFVYIMLEGYS